MLLLITGGSGSGKSAYAERQVVSHGERTRYYIATMKCADAESARRIARHRSMRADKSFITIECSSDLQNVRLAEPESVVLLECMSNLVANEFFDGRNHTAREVCDKIISGVAALQTQCAYQVIVTNEVFSDGVKYDALTEQYLCCLAMVNRALAARADGFAEIVYGIPVFHKNERNFQK